MMWGWADGMGWGIGLVTAGNLLVWILVAAGVVTLVRQLGRGRSGDSRPTAEQLLAERFARGEIGEQEYRERLDVLHQLQPRPDR